jgi:hypothetical protein
MVPEIPQSVNPTTLGNGSRRRGLGELSINTLLWWSRRVLIDQGMSEPKTDLTLPPM